MSTKTFASGFNLQLGLMTVTVDAVPVRKTESRAKTALVYVCPKCNERPHQRYACDGCEKSYEPAELVKARLVDDETLRVLTGEELTEFKEAEIDPGFMNLEVCPAEELEAKTRPDGGQYRLRLGKKPNKGTANAYALLRAMVSDQKYAVYGVARLNARCAPTAFRVTIWRDQLCLQSLIRPGELTEAEVVEGTVDKKTLTMGKKLLAALSSPLDETLLADNRSEKLAEILARGGEPVAPVEVVGEEIDLVALLQASLEAA
jgi:non-homologous end joining protein Ku